MRFSYLILESSVIQGPSKHGREDGGVSVREKSDGATQSAFKMDKGKVSQRVQPPENQKTKEFSIRACRRNTAFPPPCF